MGSHAQRIDRRRVVRQLLVPEPARAYGAVVSPDTDVGTDGWALPPTWNWAYFAVSHLAEPVGPDGHPLHGYWLDRESIHGRRMFAGARFDLRASLRLGSVVTRTTTVRDVVAKQGSQGRLLFVTVAHEFGDDDGVRLVEEQDIVYLDAVPTPVGKPAQSPPTLAWREVFRPDPVTLFRFSAATMNSHRIHYDHPYATTVEGYPDLVVHGPLLAARLADLCRRNAPGRVVRTFHFRARAALFCGEDALLTGQLVDRGKGAQLFAYSATDGRLAITARATFA